MENQLTRVAEESARSGFYLFYGQALSTILLAVSSIVIARLLGASHYGQYTLALVTPQLLFLFTDLGINQGIMKFTASLRVKGEVGRAIRIMKYGLIMRLLTGILIFALNFLFADEFATVLLQRPELSFYVRIASIGILFQVVYSTANSIFIGLDKAEYNALLTNLQAGIKAVTSIAFVMVGLGVFGAIIGHLLSYIIAAFLGSLLLTIILRRSLKHKIDTSDNLRDTKILLKYGAPLYLSTLLTGFIPLYQNIVLAFFTTDVEIGNFRAAINFASLLTVFSIPITTALLPAFSKLESAKDNGLQRFFKLANKYTAIIILPLTSIIITLSKEIVQLIYGPTYTLAPLFLTLYCSVFFLTGLGYLILKSFYNGIGQTRLTLRMNLATFSIFAVLSPAFTSIYKVPGLIIAFVAANIFSISYGAYIAKKKFNSEFQPRVIAKIYAVSISSAIPVIFILNLIYMPVLFRFILGFLLYSVIYVTALPIAQIITKSETQMIAGIIRKIPLMNFLLNPLIRYQVKILQLNENQQD